MHWDDVCHRLMEELRRLGARHTVLSTDQPIRRDGRPYAARRLIEDPGAAVYFELNGRQLVMAQDRYEGVSDNIRSLALAIEGLRKMERHGGDQMLERAFAGFEALAAPRARWEAILNARQGMSYDEVQKCFRKAARGAHPDRGGSTEAMQAVNMAWDEAKATFENG